MTKSEPPPATRTASPTPAPIASRSTSRDVARLAGVSQSTVSRALRADPRISRETQARVLEAAGRVSYRQATADSVPSPAGRRTVGVVVSDVTNPFYPELLDVLQTELSFLGLHALLFNQRTSTIMTPTLMDQLAHHSVDGLILTSVSASWQLPEAILSGELPTILLNRLIDGAHIDSVTAHNAEGGRLAAQCLLDLGHRKLGLVAGPADISTHRDRRLGFLEHVAATAGAEVFEIAPPFADYSHDLGMQSATRVLVESPETTAIFCTNDLMAFGALGAARALGRRVPEDVSIIGFDDIEMSSWPVMGLSTIHHPYKEMAKIASQLLADAMNTPTRGDTRMVQLPVRLMARSTTAALGAQS